jgi:hypothetical protein
VMNMETELHSVETVSECKALIVQIDALLDDDSISDAEYNALEAKARDLTRMLPALERAEKIAKLPQISNKFVADVCGGFPAGTHKITIRQYDAIHNIVRCTEFCCGGYLISIACGHTFGHLFKSAI